jgi:predicted dehydrogenase
VTVLGSEGRVEIEIPFNIPPDRPSTVWRTAGGDPPTAPDTETLTFPAADPYTRQAEAFAAAVREGGPAPIDPEEAVANLAVLDEIRAQSRAAAEA